MFGRLRFKTLELVRSVSSVRTVDIKVLSTHKEIIFVQYRWQPCLKGTLLFLQVADKKFETKENQMTQSKNIEFEQMYRELFPKVANFAGRLCRDKDEAEDITQDAFLKAYRAFENCDDARRTDSWLMKIVYHTFLDRKRTKSRRVQAVSETAIGIDSSIDDFADSRKTPEEIVLGESISPELLSALTTLDEDSRELIRQIFVERRDQHELSKEYGIRIGTLRTRIHRITLKLRQELLQNSRPRRNSIKALSM